MGRASNVLHKDKTLHALNIFVCKSDAKTYLEQLNIEKVKVNQFRYRPGVAQRVPRS